MSGPLDGRHVVVGVSGSIAAYKADGGTALYDAITEALVSGAADIGTLSDFAAVTTMAIGAPEEKPKPAKKPAPVAGQKAASHAAKRETPSAPAVKRDCTIRMLGMCI